MAQVRIGAQRLAGDLQIPDAASAGHRVRAWQRQQPA